MNGDAWLLGGFNDHSGLIELEKKRKRTIKIPAQACLQNRCQLAFRGLVDTVLKLLTAEG